MDLFGDRVAGAVPERPGGGALRVVPERECGLEVLLVDTGLFVDQRVDQREADGVRFGAGGEVAGEPVGGLGQLRVGGSPERSGVLIEADRSDGAGVLDGAGEVAGKA